MKNKNAFTLVELLAVIVIIGIITSFIVVNVNKYVTEAREKSYAILLKTIEDATELHVSENATSYPELAVPGSTFNITLQTLVDEGYINEPIKDERTGENINLDNYITVYVINENRFDVSFESLNQYVITYLASSGGSVTPEISYVLHGRSIDGPSYNLETGYHFTSYSVLDGEENGELNSSTGALNNVIGNMTIRANFALNTHTINYSGNGGVCVPLSRVVTYGSASAAPSCARIGYSLVNYSVTSGSCSSGWNASTGYCGSVTEDMTIAPNWSINSYAVTYNGNGGSCTPTSRTINYGSEAAAPSCTRTGYSLVNYSVTSGSCSSGWNASTGYCGSITENTTITANWTINTYAVTYNGNGGSCTPSSRTINYGSAAAAPSCTRTGYGVSNYSITSGSCSSGWNASTGYCGSVTSNMTIAPNWAVNTYTVTYNGNGGSCTPSSRTINYGSTAAAPSCTRTGYGITNYSITSGSCSSGWNPSTGYCGSVVNNMTIAPNWYLLWACGDNLTDSRDSKTYGTILIGGKCWTKEDLRYNYDGCLSKTWATSSPYNACRDNGSSSYPSYNYQWNAALAACPPGWSLPSDDDWKALEISQGMSSSDANLTDWRGAVQAVGTKLKSTTPSSWNGNNASGMNFLPVGYRFTYETLGGVGSDSGWWSSTSSGSDAYRRRLAAGYASINRGLLNQGSGYSVRCVKD